MTSSETYDIYLDHETATPEIVRGVTEITGGDGVVWYTDADGQRVGRYVEGYVVMAGARAEGGAR